MTRLISAVAVQVADDQPAGTVHLHLYATDASGLEFGQVTLNTSAETVSTHWDLLASGQTSPGSAAPVVGKAVMLGQDLSLLVIPSVGGVQYAGTAAALQEAAPASLATSAAPGSALPSTAIPQTLVTAGAVVQPDVFSGIASGAALDPRWLSVGAPSAFGMVNAQLALAPADAPSQTLLLASAPAGDYAIGVDVSLPAALLPGTQAGIELYLDDGDWLTLGIAGNGTAALCAAAWHQAVPCTTQRVTWPSPTNHTVTLRVARTGDTFTGALSLDGTTWTTVGKWSPQALASVVPTRVSTSAPTVANRDPYAAAGAAPSQPATAPLPFPCVGLFATTTSTGSLGTAAHWPVFANEALTLLPANGP
jgi:hypothetical protein